LAVLIRTGYPAAASPVPRRTRGLRGNARCVQLIALFSGTLLTLVTGPPEAVTPLATLMLAQCLVSGVLDTLPAAASPASADQG
jgi:hypothetical protein